MRNVPRLFVDACLTGPDARVEAGHRASHYLRTVLRLRPGAEVYLFNGRDGEWAARLVRATPNHAELELVACRQAQVPATGPWLLFAPLKSGPQDMLIRKAVELGVTKLQPVLTRNGQVRSIRPERIRATAIEAAEQSGRIILPDVGDAVALATVLEDWPGERRLFCCAEFGAATPIATALQSFRRDGGAEAGGAFLTGPEGGFLPEELAQLRRCSFVGMVGLGPYILRAETAALAALAVWSAVMGEWDQRPDNA